MSSTADLYAILGVARDASSEEIKRVYRQLAREHHPDTNPEDPASEERFKEISLAYEVLSDPQKRARYDALGTTGSAGSFGDQFVDLNDLFEMFFGGDPFGSRFGARGAQQFATEDAEARLTVELSEVVFGVTKTVDVRMPVPCETCQATGCAPGTTPETCSRCNGAGQLQQVRQTLFGQMVTASVCPQCRGVGQTIPQPCPDCRGEGRIRGERSIDIEVPRGIETGQHLRLVGHGPAGVRGAVPGDLYVSIGVVEHPEFERQGNDLLHVRKIGLTQAVLGTVLTIETLDGPQELGVPTGTQSGRVFRLRHHGIPKLGGHTRGDLLVRVDVEIPAKLSEEEEKLVRDWAAMRKEEVAPPDKGFFSKFKSAFQ